MSGRGDWDLNAFLWGDWRGDSSTVGDRTYVLLLDPATRTFYESRGWSTQCHLERGIEMDNAVIGDLAGVSFGFHLCRGNQGSRWLASGGYERDPQ